MRGGESDGRYERDYSGDPPDQHRQPEDGKPAAEEDKLASTVQACDAESVGDRRGGVSVSDPECDPGSDYLYAAGGTVLKGGE